MEMSFQLSVSRGDTRKIPDKTFLEIFYAAVHKSMKKKAIIFEDMDCKVSTLSFESLDKISNRMANFLYKSFNLLDKKQRVIIVSLRPGLLLPAVLLAIVKVGLSYVPIDEAFSTQRKGYILQQIQPVIAIIEETANFLPYKGTDILTDKMLIMGCKDEPENWYQMENSNIALILYTSGSTGKPKGVQIPFSAILNRLYWQWKQFPYDKEQYCITKTPLTFVDSVAEMWSPLLQERCIVIVPKEATRNPDYLIAVLEKYKIGRLLLVPSLLKTMLNVIKFEDCSRKLLNTKLWICSGEALQPQLIEEFYKQFIGQAKTLANFYGSTEVMGDVTFYVFEEGDCFIKQHIVPIGRLIDNSEAIVVNESSGIINEGQVGELLISGDSVAEGYVCESGSRFMSNNFFPHLTYEKVFRTGDYVKLEKGLFYFEGRQDSQIKIRGNKVDLYEIEEAVLRIPIIEDVTVLVYYPESNNKELVCFITLKERLLKFTKVVQTYLRRNLPSYMVPKLILIDKIPLMSNGKIDRQLLLQQLRQSKDSKNSMQFDISGVPEEYLEVSVILKKVILSTVEPPNQKFSVESSFYEIGGNSLNSLSTVLKLREFGYYIEIKDFIFASSLMDVLKQLKMRDPVTSIYPPVAELYTTEFLTDFHKEEVLRIFRESFFHKADLERWLLPHVKKQDYDEIIRKLWSSLVEKGFSFIVKYENSVKVIAVSLNFDARDEPKIFIESKLNIIFDFLEYIEKPIREMQLPKGKGAIFHTVMMATSENLDYKENINVMKFMEETCIQIAKLKNFAGIFTTNTSPLTQQLGTGILGYKNKLDYQVNRYVATDGSKPFGGAPDSQRAICTWKSI